MYFIFYAKTSTRSLFCMSSVLKLFITTWLQILDSPVCQSPQCNHLAAKSCHSRKDLLFQQEATAVFCQMFQMQCITTHLYCSMLMKSHVHWCIVNNQPV